MNDGRTWRAFSEPLLALLYDRSDVRPDLDEVGNGSVA
jgi:hypothetical protein